MNNYKKAVDKIKFSSDFESKLIRTLENGQSEKAFNKKENSVIIFEQIKRKRRRKYFIASVSAAAACLILVTGILTILDKTNSLRDNINVINGTVRSAVDAQSLDGATIVLTEKALANQDNTEQPSVITAQTDSSGCFTVEVPTGDYSAQIVKDGYIESTVDISASQESSLQQTLYLSPVMEENTYRAVLTWGKDTDLDAYLTLPDNGGRYSLFYSQSDYVSPSGDAIATLDIDNMHGDGPETVTFCPVGSGVYRFSIISYSSLKEGSNTLCESKPHVTLYKGDSVIASYSLTDKGDGNVWTVFEIENGSLKTIDKLSTVDSVKEAP